MTLKKGTQVKVIRKRDGAVKEDHIICKDLTFMREACIMDPIQALNKNYLPQNEKWFPLAKEGKAVFAHRATRGEFYVIADARDVWVD